MVLLLVVDDMCKIVRYLMVMIVMVMIVVKIVVIMFDIVAYYQVI